MVISIPVSIKTDGFDKSFAQCPFRLIYLQDCELLMQLEWFKQQVEQYI